jgi:hypothetical protein
MLVKILGAAQVSIPRFIKKAFKGKN